MERVEKPGNLGAMVRSAVGAGASAVVAADAETDFENPNVIRASQGSVFSLPVAAASTSEAVAAIDAAGIVRVTLDPAATRPIWDVDLSGRVAIAVGAEAAGVSQALVRGSTPAAIPMAGAADSLNVSVAAAVALYEAVRQRRGI